MLCSRKPAPRPQLHSGGRISRPSDGYRHVWLASLCSLGLEQPFAQNVKGFLALQRLLTPLHFVQDF